MKKANKFFFQNFLEEDLSFLYADLLELEMCRSGVGKKIGRDGDGKSKMI